MEKLHQQYKDRGVSLIAVSLADAAKTMKAVQQDRISFSVLLDPAGDSSANFPHNAIPMTYIIDRTGRVAAKHNGVLNWSSPKVFQAIDSLLSESAGS